MAYSPQTYNQSASLGSPDVGSPTGGSWEGSAGAFDPTIGPVIDLWTEAGVEGSQWLIH